MQRLSKAAKQVEQSKIEAETVYSYGNKSRYSLVMNNHVEYGLWRIKELEEEYLKSKARKKGPRKLTFYTPGG